MGCICFYSLDDDFCNNSKMNTKVECFLLYLLIGHCSDELNNPKHHEYIFAGYEGETLKQSVCTHNFLSNSGLK